MKFTKYILITLLIFCGNSYAAEYGTSENFVYDFYMWYGNELLQDKRDYPLYNDAIYIYVNKCTVDRLRIDRRRRFVDSDYFIKANDFWRKLLEDIVIKDAITISDTIIIVPVVFNAGDKKNIIFVFIENKNSSLSIIKVESVYQHF
jgi:hypothetical protein